MKVSLPPPHSLALVTGGNRGIGAEISRLLGQRGFRIAVGQRNINERGDHVVEQIRQAGGKALSIELDLENVDSNESSVQKLMSAEGPVAVLINNAAMTQEKPFLEITSTEWQTMLQVNLVGPALLSRQLMPGMKELGWGRIVNIGSVGGQWGGTNQVHYASAKAGLFGLTKSLARLGAPFGITVNAVAPGLVSTRMSADELQTAAGQHKVSQIPVGRLGTAEEVAAAVSFLCSVESAYITGQTINVNGGMYFG